MCIRPLTRYSGSTRNGAKSNKHKLLLFVTLLTIVPREHKFGEPDNYRLSAVGSPVSLRRAEVHEIPPPTLAIPLAVLRVELLPSSMEPTGLTPDMSTVKDTPNTGASSGAVTVGPHSQRVHAAAPAVPGQTSYESPRSRSHGARSYSPARTDISAVSSGAPSDHPSDALCSEEEALARKRVRHEARVQRRERRNALEAEQLREEELSLGRLPTEKGSDASLFEGSPSSENPILKKRAKKSSTPVSPVQPIDETIETLEDTLENTLVDTVADSPAATIEYAPQEDPDEAAAASAAAVESDPPPTGTMVSTAGAAPSAATPEPQVGNG